VGARQFAVLQCTELHHHPGLTVPQREGAPHARLEAVVYHVCQCMDLLCQVVVPLPAVALADADDAAVVHEDTELARVVQRVPRP